MSQPTDDLLSYAEVAKMLTISEDTLRRMISDGEWPAPTKYGKQYRWRRDKIRRYMEAVEIIQEVQMQARGFAANEGDSDAIGRNDDTGASKREKRG